MRKLIVIALIGLILLNTMGYHAVFIGLQFRNDREVVQRLNDDNYENSKAITITIPVSIPYMTDQTEFERVDGNFIYEGEYYRMVKQKYSHDALTIICYKDTETKKIQNALSDYIETFSNTPQNDESNSKMAFSFIKDYIAQSFSIEHTTEGWQSNIRNNFYRVELISKFTVSITHPPERA